MKLTLIITVLFFALFGLGIYACINNHTVKQPVIIIESVTDDRGLTSVVFIQGNDTFALDYLTLKEYNSLFGYSIENDPNAFHVGDTLLPDYAHEDTLIVVNADMLNFLFDGVNLPVPATDWEIDSTLHLYCTVIGLPECPKCGTIGCIYESIDTMTDGSDKSTFDAIMYYSKERNLNDRQVDILLHEYKLD